MKLFELFRIDGTGCAQHQVLMTLSLRERHDVADVLRLDDRHHQPIDSRGNSTVRWHTVLKGIEEVTELRPDSFRVHAEDPEHLFP